MAGHLIYANPAAEQALPGLRDRGWQHPWLAGLQETAAHLASGETAVREVEIGGSWYQQTVALIPPDHLRVYAADITKRKQAEAALRESEAKYRDLFENVTEEVHFWRLVRYERGRIETWRLVDANPSALEPRE